MKDSTTCNSSLSMPHSAVSTSCSSSSEMSDLDRLSFSISLVNLDDEDDKWVTESELEYFQSGFFPSPTWRSNWGSNHIREEKADDISYEHKDFEDADHELPLFWPFEQKKLDWNSGETWKLFSMSPRKDTIKPGSTCRRRLVFRSDSAASKLLEWKQRRKSTNNSMKKRVNYMPSRLRKSTKISSEVEDNDAAKGRNVANPELDCLKKDGSEDDFVTNEELPIEALLGLGEFDGLEGIDSKFNEEVFTLDDPF